MFEFDYNLIPLNQCIPLKFQIIFYMSSVIFLFVCSSISNFGDFSFDLIDFNSDTILDRIFSFTILMSDLWFLMIISSLLLSSCSFLLFPWYIWLYLCWFTFFSFARIFSFFSDSASLRKDVSHSFQFGDISFSPY